VSISIYDELGGQVWNKELGIADTVAGVNQVLWEGVNARGGKVANGGYILKVVSGGITVTKKIAIIR
jgi:flagellar hook assembly protein FlgD